MAAAVAAAADCCDMGLAGVDMGPQVDLPGGCHQILSDKLLAYPKSLLLPDYGGHEVTF
jgi:hypothetical protein